MARRQDVAFAMAALRAIGVCEAAGPEPSTLETVEKEPMTKGVASLKRRLQERKSQ